MNILIIVDEPADWPLDIPDVSLVAARAYLTDPFYANGVGASPAGQRAGPSKFSIFANRTVTRVQAITFHCLPKRAAINRCQK